MKSGGLKSLVVGMMVFGVIGVAPAAHAATAKATFAGGCFWSAESMFEGLKGVSSVVSGYAGGTVANPSYEQVCDGNTGHAESVQITYDPAQISYQQLVDLYWHNIDPTQKNGSFCDHGYQYRSVIFYGDADQKKIADASKVKIDKIAKFHGKVAVAIEPYKNFYPAEEYHQDFAQKNPERYHAYRVGCGRDRSLQAIWGAPGRQGEH